MSANTIALESGGLRCTLSAADGRLVEVLHVASGDVFARPGLHGGLEVFDELDRRWYSDLVTPCALEQVSSQPSGAGFIKRFADAPFRLHCCWKAQADGLRLDVRAELLPGQPQRSVRIGLVLPVTPGLWSWAPSYPPPGDVRQNPGRYCYMADERGKARTGIPLLTLYHPGRGGLSIAMPLETPKVQLNLGVEPADPRPWYQPERVPVINAGAEVDTVTPPEPGQLGEQPVMRFTEKHVGLRPDRPLEFSLWLYGHEPDWRAGLGRLVEKYADYFEPHPLARRHFGGQFGANPHTVNAEELAQAEGLGVTHAWFHAHFEFHGEFLTDEALSDPAYSWFCEPYPTQFAGLSVAHIREKIAMLRRASIVPCMYGFNMHCDPAIIEKRALQDDVARRDDGEIARAYHQQPVMFFHPDSPYGRQTLEQMDRLARMYPDMAGIALDNWNYAGIDFGHDDGLTMVNHRPAASINFAQQRMIPAIAEKMHAAGRFVMTNKGRTIESMRGVDFVTTEATGAQTFATFAYMNLLRNVSPCEYEARGDPAYAENVLQYSLVWGGQMGHFERTGDLEQARAYWPLLALLRNRRWVLEPDPLSLPQGAEGNVFRIDERSPWNAGAAVITLVQPETSWRQPARRDGLTIRVRLKDAQRFSAAEWLGVDAAGRPGTRCPLRRDGNELEIPLPPVAAAGVLKLS